MFQSVLPFENETCSHASHKTYSSKPGCHASVQTSFRFQTAVCRTGFLKTQTDAGRTASGLTRKVCRKTSPQFCKHIRPRHQISGAERFCQLPVWVVLSNFYICLIVIPRIKRAMKRKRRAGGFTAGQRSRWPRRAPQLCRRRAAILCDMVMTLISAVLRPQGRAKRVWVCASRVRWRQINGPPARIALCTLFFQYFGQQSGS